MTRIFILLLCYQYLITNVCCSAPKVLTANKNATSYKKQRQKNKKAAIFATNAKFQPFNDTIFETVQKNALLEEKLKDYSPPIQHHIVVVIPSYNNAIWHKRNLASVYGQDYKNFSVVYIDDASSDKTGRLVTRYIKQMKQELRTTLIINKTNQKALANLYMAISSLPSDVIVATMDGDDWLAKPTALSLINKVYNKYDALMTYGSYQIFPYTGKPGICKQLPSEIIANNDFRNYQWVTSQLRTFKANLFHRIKKEDFLYNETFFERTYDLACMYPMLEMAAYRSMFIPDILYIYNRATPLNDNKVAANMQMFFGKIIRAKEKYNPLPLET